MIEFTCQHCSKILKTKDDKAGLHAQCPGCGADLVVPDGSQVATLDEPEVVGEPSATRTCPMCGETVAASAVTCRYCGEKLNRKSRKLLAPHRGALILVLGILAWFICPFIGIAAWFMGTHDLQEMDAGRMDDEGRGLTQAGRIIGLVFLILGVLSLALFIVFFAIGVMGAAAGAM
jgi:predicted RNA-binding Zn-ribbon protein involved in translation (DUF1610 family)